MPPTFYVAAALLLCPPGFAATLTGRIVQDHSNAPVPSAELRVYRTGTPGLTAHLETDGDFRFHAAGLPPGEYASKSPGRTISAPPSALNLPTPRQLPS
ncbi:MAG: carboxypeptidase-like regulatory domain-containing protein [Bryobacteraceae bacterium]